MSKTKNAGIFFRPEDFVVRKVAKELIRNFIERDHYLHLWPSSTETFGISKIIQRSSLFGNLEKLVGCVVYGTPVGKTVGTGISPLVAGSQVRELKRLYIQDGHGKNIETWSIAQTFKLFRTDPELTRKNVKVFVSYADPSAKHLGTIYQAGNWTFQVLGNHKTSSFSMSLNDLWEESIHSRSITRNFPNRTIEGLKRYIGAPFWIKPDSVKYRYLYFNCSRLENRRIRKSLYHGCSAPYPKELPESEPARLIDVDSEESYPPKETIELWMSLIRNKSQVSLCE